jgi:hypothetical protein
MEHLAKALATFRVHGKITPLEDTFKEGKDLISKAHSAERIRSSLTASAVVASNGINLGSLVFTRTAERVIAKDLQSADLRPVATSQKNRTVMGILMHTDPGGDERLWFQKSKYSYLNHVRVDILDEELEPPIQYGKSIPHTISPFMAHNDLYYAIYRVVGTGDLDRPDDFHPISLIHMLRRNDPEFPLDVNARAVINLLMQPKVSRDPHLMTNVLLAIGASHENASDVVEQWSAMSARVHYKYHMEVFDAADSMMVLMDSSTFNINRYAEILSPVSDDVQGILMEFVHQYAVITAIRIQAFHKIRLELGHQFDVAFERTVYGKAGDVAHFKLLSENKWLDWEKYCSRSS